MNNRAAVEAKPSVGNQLANISADLSTLMRQEVALAKAIPSAAAGHEGGR